MPSPLDQLREVVPAVSVPVQAVGGLTLEQAVRTPEYGAPLVVLGAPLTIDADAFKTATGEVESSLRLICEQGAWLRRRAGRASTANSVTLALECHAHCSEWAWNHIAHGHSGLWPWHPIVAVAHGLLRRAEHRPPATEARFEFANSYLCQAEPAGTVDRARR